METYFTYKTPYGPLTIAANEAAITFIVLGEARLSGTLKPTLLSNRCATELQEYFAGKRTAFDLPLAPSGSLFQKEVWQRVENIPYGQTRTASEVARALGRPSAHRMVGAAVARNPIPILIPCHRIVGSREHTPANDRQASLQAACRELERRFSR